MDMQTRIRVMTPAAMSSTERSTPMPLGTLPETMYTLFITLSGMRMGTLLKNLSRKASVPSPVLMIPMIAPAQIPAMSTYARLTAAALSPKRFRNVSAAATPEGKRNCS